MRQRVRIPGNGCHGGRILMRRLNCLLRSARALSVVLALVVVAACSPNSSAGASNRAADVQPAKPPAAPPGPPEAQVIRDARSRLESEFASWNTMSEDHCAPRDLKIESNNVDVYEKDRASAIVLFKCRDKRCNMDDGKCALEYRSAPGFWRLAGVTCPSRGSA